MRVCLLKMAPIADDPRVRKQGDALASDGHEVAAIGTVGGRSAAPAWPVTDIPAPARTLLAKMTAVIRLALIGRVARLAPVLFWSFPENRRMLAAAKAAKADLFVANDWRTLPIAAAAARHAGSAYAYDSHELGVEEFQERRLWRLLFPRYVAAIESAGIGGAAYVTTVSEGIADRLRDAYRLDCRPTVVRNIPPYAEVERHPLGVPITVLYHGMLIGNRGIEPLIDSVVQWRPEFRLIIRGMGKASYERRLQRLVEQSPARDRISLAPPVPMMEMVKMAAAADVGIHPLQITSDQTRYTLPNKLFEYLMAGLAVCVTAVPEMTDVVERFGVGITIGRPDCDGIAAAVNSLTHDSIAQYRRAAEGAARELCWEREQERLVQLVRSLSPPTLRLVAQPDQ